MIELLIKEPNKKYLSHKIISEYKDDMRFKIKMTILPYQFKDIKYITRTNERTLKPYEKDFIEGHGNIFEWINK